MTTDDIINLLRTRRAELITGIEGLERLRVMIEAGWLQYGRNYTPAAKDSLKSEIQTQASACGLDYSQWIT